MASKEVSPQEKELLREFHSLRDQKYELEKLLDNHNVEFQRVRESFVAKNPSVNFIGSSEWDQVMKKERQLAHDYVELEDKIKVVEGKLDALVSPEERKLNNQMSKIEDQISDLASKIDELEDDGKSTVILEQRKAIFEKKLDSLLTESQALESQKDPKAGGLAVGERTRTRSRR
jgi:predicted  nucleic acid-binding Zn-ribbon protein